MSAAFESPSTSVRKPRKPPCPFSWAGRSLDTHFAEKGHDMDWYKFDISAYQRATEGLNGTQDGMYRRMIDACYQREGPLPADLQTIFRLTHALTRAEKAAVATVLERFWVLVSGHYHNSRCDEELLKYQEVCDTARKAIGIRWEQHGVNGAEYRKIDREKERSTSITTTTSKPVDNSCQHHMENGEVCGKTGTHKLHPSSKDWFCRSHLDG